MEKFKVLRNSAIGTLLAMSTALSASTFAHADTTAPITANVTVNASSLLATVPATALGVNTAVWDGHLMDSEVPALLKQINAAMLRYPGGSTSDVYNWKTNSAPGSWAWPQDNFDNFMKLVQAAGAQPIITVNGSYRPDGDPSGGSPEEAAAWVKYANVDHNYGVKYWEIGNELYGTWENGNFAGNPAGYAQWASQYIKAMKAEDPTIKIGVVLIAPGTGDPKWNDTVLSTLHSLGTDPDFGIVHWYPLNSGGETNASLLNATSEIPTMMSALKQQLGNIPVFVTETNDSGSTPSKLSTSLLNALFLDDNAASWVQAGAANVDWWDLYNGPVTASDGANVDPSLYGKYNYGDYGLLSSGGTSSDSTVTEPPANTPFPAYYGYQMLGPVIQPEATMVAAGSDNNLVAVHASKLPNGDLAVMLINKDPNNTYNVNLNLQGYLARDSATEYSYGEDSSSVTQSQVSNVQSVQIPPYSVTDLILQQQNGHQPKGPKVTDSTSVAQASIKPGKTQTVTTTFTDTRAELNNATLKVEIDDPSGNIVAQQVVTGVSFKPGQTDATPVTLNWSVPDAPGNYTVRAFAFSSDGAATYLADQSAATFTVTQPDEVVNGDITVSTTVSPSTVTVGSPVTITTTLTNTSKADWLANGNVILFAVYDWSKFNPNTDQAIRTVSLAPGQSATETWTYTPTVAASYQVYVGLSKSDWSAQIQWYNDTADFTATN
ncbi:MAG: hypothetical protein K6T83_12525 [Alicyclobacillus sp.]|nr:hypothetical protein [Alicyclobacillus sp.]